jgi:molybdenum cofactor cytidylyltransferase
MGQPKLLLPLAGAPLLMHTLSAWKQSSVDQVFVVVRPGDESLADFIRTTGVELVVPPAPPPDMKASIQAALHYIEQNSHPLASDAFLVAPADMPRLAPAVINLLINFHASSSGQVLIPTLAGQHGHPVLLPWSLAPAVHALAADEGLNSLVRRSNPTLVPCDGLSIVAGESFSDIDTPDEYRRAAGEY